VLESPLLKLSIIFVNWNSVEYLRECLASICAQTQRVEFEIIVVDNASPERGVEALRDLYPEIKIILSEENLGFARANNLGFRNSTGHYVLFLNPDTQLTSPAINIMLERISAIPDAGIMGCKMLNSDLTVQITSIQKFPTILNQVLDIEFFQMRWPHCPLWDISPLFADQVKLLKVEVITGACMLMRREVFEQIGHFSEDYFMYAEDIDLNIKANKAGYANYYVGDAVMIHHGGKSSSRQSVSHWSTIMKYRAMGRMFQKTRGKTYAAMYRTAIGTMAAVRLTLLYLAYPLGNIVWKKQTLKFAMQKWSIILSWALGSQKLANGNS
jgi:N-acetylglucosaminyl-diphospho-decaprenol L-rhamnosyltransferase